MDKHPRKLLQDLPEYRYITNPKRRKYLQAVLIDGMAPTTAAKLIGVNAGREKANGEVINCTKAFREKADPREEIIAFWQAIYDADWGPGVRDAREDDKRNPLPDPKASMAALDEIDRRYHEKKEAYRASQEAK
jgi:hypothetical protein